MSVAFLFPGQGSQKVGMGKALCDVHPPLKRRFFDRADELLGFSLSLLCFEGPNEELVKTENQQPAIFLVSTAICALLDEAGLRAQAVAGHSLGEYSALVAAGSIAFDQGLVLTRRRGELMAEIGAKTGGMMAAIIGLPAEAVEDVCREAATAGVVEVANLNSPIQSVISGEEPAVRQAMEIAEGRGVQRVVALSVSAPFHCSLMAPLAGAFQPILDQVEIQNAEIPVVANVTADFESTADDIRRNLLSQLASSVRWTASMRRLVDSGVNTVIEVGPGRVLSNLMRSIDPGVTTLATNDPATIEATLRGIQNG